MAAISAPCSLYVSCMAFSLFQRRPWQALGLQMQSFRAQQSTCMWAMVMVSFGSMVFSSLSTQSPFLSWSNSPI